LITHYDLELLEKAKLFLDAAGAQPESRAFLERYGFNDRELERGRQLVSNTERSFEWEREGKAWNFLSPTAARRTEEARYWYADTRRRYLRACLRAAEEESGWVGYKPSAQWSVTRKLTEGVLIALRQALRAASPAAYLAHRAELRRNLVRALGERPADAPPPKDSSLVELSGWYEHWRLLAQRVFRGRPDLMTPYGLVPGKAPPRLRSRSARAKYGEGAAGSAQQMRPDEAHEPEAAPAGRVLRVID
jgi:hypothetical protein